MKVMARFGAGALTLALVLSAASARASTISVGLQESSVNGGAITTVSSGPLVAGVLGLSYGDFTVTTTGTGTPLLPSPGLLDSNSLDASSTGTGTLSVYVTAQGITGPLGSVDFFSSFTSNFLTEGWTVVESTFYDATNSLYGGTLLDFAGFSAIGTSVESQTVNGVTGPYSVTERYIVHAVGEGAANSTIDLSAAAVPEPASLMLLGTGLLGLARRGLRRKK